MEDLPKLNWKQPAPRDKFKLFKQRLELYFKVKKITNDKERCYYLLRALDDDALEVFNSWNLDGDTADSYKEIVKKFEETLGQTAINFRVARLQLHFMHQEKRENLDSFVTRCRTQALKYEFEPSELESRIIEQIIASTPIQKFQSKLLSKDKPSLSMMQSNLGSNMKPHYSVQNDCEKWLVETPIFSPNYCILLNKAYIFLHYYF